MVVSPPAGARTAGDLSIRPTSGAPGRQALVTGQFTGYGTYDFVTIWWDYINDGRRLGNVPLRADGTFALPVRIPPEASLGSHQVIADVNAGYDQASTTFEVTAPDRSAAYIYKDDTGTANDFKSLLEGNGVNTTLL